MKKTIKKLQKRPHPVGVRPRFADRIRGKRDARNNQLRDYNGSPSTPWLMSAIVTLSKYYNQTYAKVTAALEPIAVELERICEEITITKLNALSDDNASEISLRNSAAVNAKLQNLLLRLSELSKTIDTVDSVLSQNLESAEKDTFRHIYAYWEGILRVSDESLPASPEITLPSPTGKTVYEEYICTLRARINDAINMKEV